MNQLYHDLAQNASSNLGQDKPNYYAVIPADVRYDIDLKPNAKLLYGEISALIGPEGYCFASNTYFARLFQLTEETVSRLVSQLLEKGYILRAFDYGSDGAIVRRRLYLRVSVMDGLGIDEKINTPCAKNQGGIDEKVKDTNLSITNIEIDPIPDRLSKSDMDELFFLWIQRQADRHGWAESQKMTILGDLRDLYGPRQLSKHSSPPIRSERGVNTLLGKLDRHCKGNADMVHDLLNEAIARGWTSIVIPGEQKRSKFSRGSTGGKPAAPKERLGEEW